MFSNVYLSHYSLLGGSKWLSLKEGCSLAKQHSAIHHSQNTCSLGTCSPMKCLSLKRARIVFLTSILDWERRANAISDNRALIFKASSSFMLLCSFFTCSKPTLISHSFLNPYCFFFSASYLCSLHHELQDLDPLVLHNIQCCRLMHSNLFPLHCSQ